MIKVVCDLWSNGIKSSKGIKDTMKLGRNTVIRYLTIGAKLGWCDYNGQREIERKNKNMSKPVVQLTLDGEFIKEYDSVSQAFKQTNIYSNSITPVCKGVYKTGGGFKWMYKDDYDKLH